MTFLSGVVLATDSAEPSGLGRMMLTLAAGLPGVRLRLPDHAAGRALVAEARARGIEAATVRAGDWAETFRDAPLVNVHAGIGWEGHELCRLARSAGATVVRTEHLPWLLTDPAQIEDYRRNLPNVDRIVAVGEAATESWRPVAGDRLICIPNGIDQAAQATAPPAAPVILCVARFTRQKDHRTLIAAMARLHRQRPEARLILVGTGPEEDAIRRRIARHHLPVEIRARGDIPDLMAQARVIVLPSQFEGLALVVLEAMAAGRAVVASRVDGIAEALCPDHPWLVPPGDARALAAALADALDRPDAVTDLQARRFHARYTARRMTERTHRLFTSLLTAQRTRHMTTRLGFIGAGGIAHRHFGVLEQMEDVRIVAVCDPDTARAEEAARRFGAEAFATHDAMLDGVELDAVFICIPPFAHGAPERACITKGLPFFVEKPLSLDLNLAEEISAEVEAAGLVTAVGYHWRYVDTVDEARAHLRDNPAHLMTGFWLDQTPPPRWWWREDGSGGQIVEQATHVIDLARFLAGDVTDAFGLAAQRPRDDFDGLDVPTATTASLRFAGGAIANLSATCLLRWNHRVGLHVYADALVLEITDHDIMVDVGRGRPVRHSEGDPVWREDRDFIEAVQGRENRIRCPYSEALETHRVALAISQSAASGLPVKMEVLRSNPQPFFRETPA